MSSSTHSRRIRRGAGAIGLIAALSVVSACSAVGVDTSIKNGYLTEGVTEESRLVEDLWIWSWVAALAVGVLVWGLTLWCMVAYRKRKDDDGSLPVQLQYNVPLEILYTVVPMFMVGALFFYTEQAQSTLQDTSQEPDVTINVVGKQWSWDFNYVDANVYQTGDMAQLDGKAGAEKDLPTLYLPKGQRVEFVLTSRDVIHSFWVPAFLEKMDVNPGIVNRFQVVPSQTGTFQGKCAELCGAYHSQMLFNVKIVEPAEFQAYLQGLRDKGQTGLLGIDLNREGINERDRKRLEEALVTDEETN